MGIFRWFSCEKTGRANYEKRECVTNSQKAFEQLDWLKKPKKVLALSKPYKMRFQKLNFSSSWLHWRQNFRFSNHSHYSPRNWIFPGVKFSTLFPFKLYVFQCPLMKPKEFQIAHFPHQKSNKNYFIARSIRLFVTTASNIYFKNAIKLKIYNNKNCENMFGIDAQHFLLILFSFLPNWYNKIILQINIRLRKKA